MIVYLAGPYRAKSLFGVLRNIIRAWKKAIDLWRQGYTVVCPHMNTFWMSEPPIKIAPDLFLYGDLDILRRCDVLYLLPGWERSTGSIGERDEAFKVGMPVVYHDDERLAHVRETWHLRAV